MIASMYKYMYLLLVVGFGVALTQARPQYKPPSYIFRRPAPRKPIVPLPWSLGKIPGGAGDLNVGIDANGKYIKGPSASGINYGKGNWKVGVGADPLNKYFNKYGGVGFSYNFGK